MTISYRRKGWLLPDMLSKKLLKKKLSDKVKYNKNVKKQHILLRYKESREQMRNKVSDMYQTGKDYNAIGLWDLKRWWTFPGVACLPKSL